MEVLQLTATQFLRAIDTGRTHPLLIGAEAIDGRSFEVVVKLRGPEMTVNSMIAELLSAQLADLLGLAVPQSAVVVISTEFADIVPVPNRPAVQGSLGENFGSMYIGKSFTTYPAYYTPVDEQRSQAASIFAFDLLSQNPDRGVNNPNVWMNSEHLGVFDHEQAFSFLHLPIIGGVPRPWILNDLMHRFQFLDNHVFREVLREKKCDIDSFEDRLSALSDASIATIIGSVPESWNIGFDWAGDFKQYLIDARQHASTICNHVKYLLQ